MVISQLVDWLGLLDFVWRVIKFIFPLVALPLLQRLMGWVQRKRQRRHTFQSRRRLDGPVRRYRR